MSIESDMRERHGRVLAELAEAGMAMVRRLGEATLRTDDIQTQAHLGLAFHRVSRAVRQTMALEFRMTQAARREHREAVAPARPTPPPRPAAPRAPSERTGWDEYEPSDADEALEELDVLLEAEDVDMDAVHGAVEICVARIRHDLDADRALVEGDVREPATALSARRPALDLPAISGPGGRRSRLMGAAAPTRPLGAGPPSVLAWRSSA